MPRRSRSSKTSRPPSRGRATTREHVPVRTCAGCGRRAPQPKLLRFAAVEGVLMPGRTLPGRGAYTCADVACFERAVARHAFRRILRSDVQVRPELARLYTEESHG